jgi:sugar transport system substrate-binding protein
MPTKFVAGVCGVMLALAALVAPARAADPEFKIANIVFQNDQFMQLVLFGARDAAKKAGNVDLHEGNSNGKIEKEQQLVDAFIVGKMDALLLTPLSKKASVQTVKRAKESGMIVIAYNTPVEGGYEDAYIECDPHDLGWQTGQVAAKYIKEKLGGKAKIAILAFKSQVPEQSDARTGGFKDALKDIPGVEIVAEQDAWLSEMAVKKAGDILTANPDLDIIWAANEGGTVGSVLAVKNAGKAGKVVVFGTDVSEQLLHFAKSDDNILQAITAQRPFEAGQKAVETALKLLKKEPVDKKISMKGVCLMRSDPAGIDAYEQQLKTWMAQGKQ